MKRIFCYFAQRNPHANGAFAKHVSACPDCRDFFAQVDSLETRLVTKIDEPDRELCDEIMGKISARNQAPITAPGRAWISSPIVLPIVTALVLLLIGVLAVSNFEKPAQIVEAPAGQVDAPAPPIPEAAPKATLAYAREQQEFLQRDALKLGAHLRANLIMFRAEDQSR